VWLVALIVAPFSAPFSVCDAATFFDVKSAYAAASVNDATTHTLPVVRAKHRVNVMDGVPRPLPAAIAFASSACRCRPNSALFANSPLVSPLRI
jgi:hypothetical protein